MSIQSNMQSNMKIQGLLLKVCYNSIQGDRGQTCLKYNIRVATITGHVYKF